MEKHKCPICGKEGISSAKKEEGGLSIVTMVFVPSKKGSFYACKEGHSKTAEGLSIQRYHAQKKEVADGKSLESKKLEFPICSECGKRHYRKAGKPCEFQEVRP